MTEKTWLRLRVVILMPAGAILALVVLFRDDLPWWVPGLMLLHLIPVGWLLWLRMANKVKADRDD